jgi:peptidoglycan/LPS O-acetylase OafA/YrhL
LQVIALPAIGKLVVRFLPRISGDLIILMSVVLIVSAGMLLYSVVERPLLKALQAVFLPRIDRAPLSASVT